MIKSFYTIGNVLSKDEVYAEYFEPWSNPFPKSNNIKIIIINIINGKFTELSESDYKKGSTKDLLFRKPGGSNSDKFLTPTIPITEKGLDKVKVRIKSTLKNLIEKKIVIINEDELFKIEESIKNYSLNLNKNYVVTFKIDNRWLGEINEFLDLVNQDAYEKYYKKEKGISKSLSGICSITGENGEVWGFVDVLGFTVDSTSFLRNGFDINESYKMFPVSPKAAKKLEGVKRLIFESDLKLTNDFYGLKFFILPHFLNASEETIKETIEIFLNKSSDKSSLESFGRSIINKELIINEIIEDEKLSKNGIYYDIFFYQILKKQLAIKLHLSDVLPSRFREIFEAKSKIERKYELLNRVSIKAKTKNTQDNVKPYRITFGGIEKSFPPIYGIKDYLSKKVRKDIIFHPYFYKVLEAVFYGISLNKETILKAFMEKIVIAFKNVKDNPNDFARHVKTSFIIFQFFNELKLLKSNIMEEKKVSSDEVALNIDNFMKQHDDFFEDDIKKGAFYLGFLTNILLEKQNSHLQSKPFMNQLNGLNLDSDQMQKIHLKLIDKLYQYNDKLKMVEHQIIAKLNPLISKNLICKSGLSRTELSYAFALGMTMQKEFFLHNLNIQQSKS